MLADHGHVAQHVTNIAPGDAPDRELWRYALEHGAVLVTKDADFVDMVVLGHESPVIVWVRIGNTRRRALLEWFEPLIDPVVGLIESGSQVIELR